jgi:hypothetical protein
VLTVDPDTKAVEAYCNLAKLEDAIALCEQAIIKFKDGTIEQVIDGPL